MSTSNGLERDLARWMEDVAPMRAPEDLAPSITERTGSMRPRPGWLARLLESPMQTQLPLGASRAFGRPATVLLVALLAVALIAGALVVGAQLLQPTPLPAPFGKAGNGLIAADLDGEIVLIQPDGSTVRRLDLPFTGLSEMSFSRDGTRFAAWSTPDPLHKAKRALVVANADGSGAFVVDPETVIFAPSHRIAWSPDDRRLAFSDGGDVLYVADLDRRRIETLGSDAWDRRHPSWSPDGQLAYRCGEPDGTLHLCLMNADGTGERVLPTSGGTEFAFQGSSWSPDGRYIAYYIDDVDGSGGWDVTTLELASGTELNLTRGTTDHAIFPVWTPDGGHLLFNSGGPTGIVGADGKGLRLVGDIRCQSLVDPSPDGRFATCVTEGGLALSPIAGGEPTIIPLGAAGNTISWQRVAD